MTRVLVGRPSTVYWTLEDGDGNTMDATGTPSVIATRNRDSTVLSPVTVAHVAPAASGKYAITLPAQAAPELITASVTAVAPAPLSGTITDAVDVSAVTARLVNLSRLKQDSELAALSADVLREALEATEDECRDNLGYPPTPAMEKVDVDTGGRMLVTPNPWPRYIVAATRPNGTVLTGAEIAMVSYSDGALIWSDRRNWDEGTWAVWLVHGRWDVPPVDLQRAALIRARFLARRLANKDQMLERASTVTTESGTMSFAFPTLPRPTGLPDVDIVYMRYALASQMPVKV